MGSAAADDLSGVQQSTAALRPTSSLLSSCAYEEQAQGLSLDQLDQLTSQEQACVLGSTSSMGLAAPSGSNEAPASSVSTTSALDTGGAPVARVAGDTGAGGGGGAGAGDEANKNQSIDAAPVGSATGPLWRQGLTNMYWHQTSTAPSFANLTSLEKGHYGGVGGSSCSSCASVGAVQPQPYQHMMHDSLLQQQQQLYPLAQSSWSVLELTRLELAPSVYPQSAAAAAAGAAAAAAAGASPQKRYKDIIGAPGSTPQQQKLLLRQNMQLQYRQQLQQQQEQEQEQEQPQQPQQQQEQPQPQQQPQQQFKQTSAPQCAPNANQQPRIGSLSAHSKLTALPGSAGPLPPRQVSSQGCSRVFITKGQLLH